jgi:hypothetical protein
LRYSGAVEKPEFDVLLYSADRQLLIINSVKIAENNHLDFFRQTQQFHAPFKNNDSTYKSLQTTIFKNRRVRVVKIIICRGKIAAKYLTAYTIPPKVEGASADHKDMPNHVMVRQFPPSIKDQAYRIRKPAQNKKGQAERRDVGDYFFKGNDSQPAHET